MKPTKDLDLLLTLHPHGWSTCWLWIEEKSYQLVISHVFGEPWEEWMQALARLIKGQQETSCYWYGEPVGHKWNFQLQQQEVEINLEQFQEAHWEEPEELEELVSFQLQFSSFLTLAYYQLKKTAQLLKDPAFAAHRNGDFPFAYFKQWEQEVLAYLESV